MSQCTDNKHPLSQPIKISKPRWMYLTWQSISFWHFFLSQFPQTNFIFELQKLNSGKKKACGKNGWVPSSHNGTCGNIEAEDVSKWQKMGSCTPDVDRTAKARDGGWVTVDYFGSVSLGSRVPRFFFLGGMQNDPVFVGSILKTITRWWFRIIFDFHSENWERFPFWLIFFNGVETTN